MLYMKIILGMRHAENETNNEVSNKNKITFRGWDIVEK